LNNYDSLNDTVKGTRQKGIVQFKVFDNTV